MRPVSDLVRDSKLRTAIQGNITRHLIETSGRNSLQRKVRKEQQWQHGELLGEGGFGVVWKETLLSGESDVKERAVKMIKKRVNKSKPFDYRRELEAIAKFSHPKYNPYFVESYGWFESDESVFIIMEYLPHGDLQEQLADLSSLPELDVQKISFQVLEGLAFMHDNDFAHRDLKPSNILIKDLGPDWWCKIADFGISKRAEEGMTALRTFSGTLGFVAPEVLVRSGMLDAENLADEKEYTLAVDIWAMGEIIYRSLCGESPFTKSLAAYVNGTSSLPLDTLRRHSISDEGCDLIQRLMKVQPKERPTAAKALQHAWFAAQQPSPRSSGEFPSLESVQLDLPSLLKPAANDTRFTWNEPSVRWSALDDTADLAIGPSKQQTVGSIRHEPPPEASLLNFNVAAPSSPPQVPHHDPPDGNLDDHLDDLPAPETESLTVTNIQERTRIPQSHHPSSNCPRDNIKDDGDGRGVMASSASPKQPTPVLSTAAQPPPNTTEQGGLLIKLEKLLLQKDELERQKEEQEDAAFSRIERLLLEQEQVRGYTELQKKAEIAAKQVADYKKRTDEEKLAKLEKLILAQKAEQLKREAEAAEQTKLFKETASVSISDSAAVTEAELLEAAKVAREEVEAKAAKELGEMKTKAAKESEALKAKASKDAEESKARFQVELSRYSQQEPQLACTVSQEGKQTTAEQANINNPTTHANLGQNRELTSNFTDTQTTKADIPLSSSFGEKWSTEESSSEESGVIIEGSSSDESSIEEQRNIDESSSEESDIAEIIEESSSEESSSEHLTTKSARPGPDRQASSHEYVESDKPSAGAASRYLSPAESRHLPTGDVGKYLSHPPTRDSSDDAARVPSKRGRSTSNNSRASPRSRTPGPGEEKANAYTASQKLKKEHPSKDERAPGEIDANDLSSTEANSYYKAPSPPPLDPPHRLVRPQPQHHNIYTNGPDRFTSKNFKAPPTAQKPNSRPTERNTNVFTAWQKMKQPRGKEQPRANPIDDNPNGTAFGRNTSTRMPSTKKGGFDPATPSQGDEGQAPSSYRSSYERSVPPAPPPRDPTDPFPSLEAKDSSPEVPYAEDSRVRTPYSFKTGERTSMFEEPTRTSSDSDFWREPLRGDQFEEASTRLLIEQHIKDEKARWRKEEKIGQMPVPHWDIEQLIQFRKMHDNNDDSDRDSNVARAGGARLPPQDKKSEEEKIYKETGRNPELRKFKKGDNMSHLGEQPKEPRRHRSKPVLHQSEEPRARRQRDSKVNERETENNGVRYIHRSNAGADSVRYYSYPKAESDRDSEPHRPGKLGELENDAVRYIHRSKADADGRPSPRYETSSRDKNGSTGETTSRAKDRGWREWQRCYDCKALVELQEGCNHMTCRCTAQFCAICALPWKTCNCPWFNYEDRLDDVRVPRGENKGGRSFTSLLGDALFQKKKGDVKKPAKKRRERRIREESPPKSGDDGARSRPTLARHATYVY